MPSQSVPARLLALACALASLLCSGPVQAQAPARAAAGTLAGRVLDATSGHPLAHALVVLEPTVAGLMSDGRAELVRSRWLVTGESGAYRFADVAPGLYRLRIERLGYRVAALELDVRRAADAAVSVALELEPVALEPMRIEQRAPSLRAAAQQGDGTFDEARLASERARQELFLSPDARVLTYADVSAGVTLGEGDVFRALQRFAGVATRDDYTAELWTRGAPWTHTRITFDGVPLFNPVHAVGVLSAIAPEVLGAVYFHPGVAPASLAGGAAGAVDLRTRPGGGDGELRGVADVSMASAKLMLDQAVARRASWVVAARRSHLDVLRGGLDWLGLDTLDLPYVFHDIAARADVALGSGARLETSALWEEDRLHGDVPGVLERTHARWGNAAGRATLSASVRGVELRQNLGGSRFEARTDARTLQTRGAVPPWTEPASRNHIRHLQVGGSLQPAAAGEAPRWSAGYEVTWQNVEYDGPRPRYHAVKPDTTERLQYTRSFTTAGIFADARLGVGRRLVVSPGVRLDMGGVLAGGGVVRPAPRVAARLVLSPQQTLSLAAGRSWQYAQALALAGPSIHPAFHASHFWVWPDARTPAIRADLISIGTERWLRDGWLAAATVYARHATGLTLPDPTPGRLGGRPLFVTGENGARGVELALRRIGAAWSLTTAYAYSLSELEIAGERYASPADRRHVLDAVAGVRVAGGLRLLAAYTAMSGAPFTRAHSRSPQDCTSFGFGCDNPTGSYVEAHNAQRTPAYRSVDASLQWARPIGGAEIGAYVQLRNVLGRDNASTYAGSIPIGRISTAEGTRIVWQDRFERGLPRLPLAGVRIAF